MTYSVPGVYWDKLLPSTPVSEIETGVPVFLGYAKLARHLRCLKRSRHPLTKLTSWEDFSVYFGLGKPDSYLAPAVKGFFQNGGRRCYVMPLPTANNPQRAKRVLALGLKKILRLEEVDLVCTPDIMKSVGMEQTSDPTRIHELQGLVLRHCDEAGDRFAILDSPPEVSNEQAVDARHGLVSANGALYYPWVRVEGGAEAISDGVPPCGHIAGVYAHTDANLGVFKAPANELVEGVIDLMVHLTDEDQGPLNELGVNCLRSLGGRGIRVWGARTLSGLLDWRYVNVRRLFITLGRWIRQYQAHICFEPHTEQLWASIERDLTVYLGGLFQRGALKGDTPGQAFYVKCDAETNPSFSREEGCLVTEVGLCPRVPGEFIVVQLFQKPDGIHLVGIPEPSRT